MNNFFVELFDCVRRKRGYLFIILILSLVAIVLGVVASINFDGDVFSVDLSKIAYIKFLKGECGLVSLIFNMSMSLMVFFIIVLICNKKSFLIPVAIAFYLYLVYSQVVILVSLILIYGFLNCFIFAILLLIYDIFIWSIFILITLELSNLTNRFDYFKKSCSFRESKTLFFILFAILGVITFSFILMVLKNYVVLLIY